MLLLFTVSKVPHQYTLCSPLKADRDCAHENNNIRSYSNAVDDCRAICAREAAGGSGCCEWQADWDACLFVPYAQSVPENTLGERHAIDCVSSGLYTINYSSAHKKNTRSKHY